MVSQNQQTKPSLVEFFQSLHLYSRWDLAKRMGSRYCYGENGFGDAKILAQAKEHFFKMKKDYDEQVKDEGVEITRNQKPELPVITGGESKYGNTFLFHLDTTTGLSERERTALEKGKYVY